MSKPICDSQKYQLDGPNEDVIGLPVQLADLPKEISYNLIMLDCLKILKVAACLSGRFIIPGNK